MENVFLGCVSEGGGNKTRLGTCSILTNCSGSLLGSDISFAYFFT